MKRSESKGGGNLGNATSYAAATPIVVESGWFEVLDPRSRFMRNWDVVVVILIFYTAFVTPFEVSFIDKSRTDSGLFISNRVVDFLFAFDVMVNFNLMYWDVELGWVTKRSLICKNYLSGFAIVDLASTVPYDVIVDGETGSLRRLKALRLIKLMRMFRSARVISRLADQFYFHYSYLTLFNFAFGTVLLAHWMACLLHMVKDMSGEDCNWLNLYFNAQAGNLQLCDDVQVPMESAYLAALYWAGMTISTVGYGDVVPANDGERAFVIASLLVGTSFFSYIVGSVCGVLAKLSADETKFQDKMSLLNLFIRGAKLGQPLATSLRRFFRYKNTTGNDDKWWLELLEEMPLGLQGAVATEMHSNWLRELEPLLGAPTDMVIKLLIAFKSVTLPPSEILLKVSDITDKVYVIRKGWVMVGSKYFKGSFTLKGSGAIIGEQLLYTDALKSEYGAITLSYTDVQVIEWSTLDDILAGSQEFVDGPFEKYRRWRAFLSKLRVFYRSVKCVRARYESMSTINLSSERFRPSSTASAVPLSSLLMAAASVQGSDDDAHTGRVSSTAAANNEDSSLVKPRMGATLRESIRRRKGREDSSFMGSPDKPGRMFFTDDWALPPHSTLFIVEIALPEYWETITYAAVTIQQTYRRHLSLRFGGNPELMSAPSTQGTFRGLAAAAQVDGSGINTPRDGGASMASLQRLLDYRFGIQLRQLQRLQASVSVIQMELQQLRDPTGGPSSTALNIAMSAAMALKNGGSMGAFSLPTATSIQTEGWSDTPEDVPHLNDPPTPSNHHAYHP